MSRAVPTVNELVERLQADDKTKRFSRVDYRDLVFAVLSDDTFKAKKYLFRKDEMFEEEVSYKYFLVLERIQGSRSAQGGL